MKRTRPWTGAPLSRILAAAACGAKAATTPATKTLFKKLSRKAVTSVGASTPKKTNKNTAGASFALAMAKYQKGDKEGQDTGNVYMRAVPVAVTPETPGR